MSYPNDFLEIDFLAVETAKSGDAIAIQYAVGGTPYIHVVDGGFTDMGETILEHVKQFYTTQKYIDNVVLTHPDQDHALGLKYILENYEVKALRMNRPWIYVDELLPRFKSYNSAEHLARELKKCYPVVSDLEEIAEERGVAIYETFQGSKIGSFTVMAPSRERFIDLIVNSNKTPEANLSAAESLSKALAAVMETLSKAANLVKAAWGAETFSSSGVSAENEMSIVQYASFNGTKYLLTGDAGKEALQEVINYAPYVGLSLPGIDRFQVPHHGSRRNVSTELLDALLGKRLTAPVAEGAELFTAIISSALADTDHPRKSVERAMHHRGARVLATEGESIRVKWNAPARDGWSTAAGRAYPEDQEE
jgi:beta-lactamase superfamily II metal-dependent hydrolase